MKLPILDPKEPGDLDVTLRTIAEVACETFAAAKCLVVAVNPVNNWLVKAVLHVTAGSTFPVEQLERTDLVAQTQTQAVWYSDQSSASASASQTVCALLGCPTFAAIALRTRRRQRTVGILCLGLTAGQAFEPEKDAMLREFAEQAGTVLRNTWYLRRYQEVVRIGQELNSQLETPESLFMRLRQDIADVLDVSSFFMLAVYQPQTHTLDLYASDCGNYRAELAISPGSFSAKLLRTQQAYLIGNRSRDPKAASLQFEQIPGAKHPMPESLIFVPLTLRGVPLGILSVQHHQPNIYQNEDLKILQLLGNQVALALSSLRLYEYLRFLDQTGQELTQRLSFEPQSLAPEELLQETADRIREATRADLVILFPYIQAEDRFLLPPCRSGALLRPDLPPPQVIKPDNMARRALARMTETYEKEAQELYRNLDGEMTAQTGKFVERERICSAAALPLRAGEEAVGVLFVNFRQPQRFDAPQRHLISTLASYAATAIRNSRAFDEVKNRRIEELKLLRRIDQGIGKSLKLKEVLQTILEMASQRVKADDASLFLYSTRTKTLEAMAALGPNSAYYLKSQMSLDEPSIVVEVFKRRKSVRIGNVYTDLRWHALYRSVVRDVQSQLCVPLLTQNEAIGVINFESARENAFSEQDLEFLVTLAGQAVQAVKNAQTFERERELVTKLAAVREVEHAYLQQQGESEETIRIISKNAITLTGAEIAGVHLYQANLPHKTYYVHGRDGEFLRYERPQSDQPGIVEHVAKTRRAYLTNNAEKDPLYSGEKGIRSEIAVPLIAENELYGVINLESTQEDAFDQNDLLLMEEIAAQIVIALQTSRRYRQAQEESERFRLLWEAGQELATVTDPQQLERAYDIVVHKLAPWHPGEIVIRRYDPELQELRCVRVHEPLTEVIPPSIGLHQGVNGQVARERRTIHLPDADHPPPDVAPLLKTGADSKTLVVTPIQVKDGVQDRYYGNVVFSHKEAHWCSEADVKLIEGLAQQLALTLFRFETLQEKLKAEQKARDLEIVGEVGSSTYELTHRLGNDLGLIRSYVNNIRLVLAEAKIESQPIDEELQKLLKDVGNVLSMSAGLKQKVAALGEQGKLAQNPVRLPVKELLEQARWSLPGLPENIRLNWEVTGELGEINVVPGQLVDILYSLIINAREALPEGGEITLRAFLSGPAVHIEVADTGPGIPPKMQDKIFNLFFSTKKSSGFGLWSARRYARANGGELTVKSSPEQGGTFILRLPLAAPKSGGEQ